MFDGFHLSSPLTSYQEVNPESESHFRSIVQVLVEGNPQIKKKHKCHPSLFCIDSKEQKSSLSLFKQNRNALAHVQGRIMWYLTGWKDLGLLSPVSVMLISSGDFPCVLERLAIGSLKLTTPRKREYLSSRVTIQDTRL